MDILAVDRDTYDISGGFISGIDSVLWVERYNKPGMFRIVGSPDVLRDKLPEKTFITHPETTQVMEVETHVVDETEEGSPKVVITGRDVASIIMENRVVSLVEGVGGWTTIATTPPANVENFSFDPPEFFITDGYSWEHVLALLDHCLVNSPFGTKENLPNFAANTLIVGGVEPNYKPRIIKRLSLLSTAVYDILQASDVGLKIERPNLDHENDLYFIVHEGIDLSETVRFGWNSGDLKDGRYLWSGAAYKNGFYGNVGGFTIVNHDYESTGWDSRIMPIDGNDWDPDPTDYPAYPTDDAIYESLSSRGRDEVNKRNSVKLIDSATADSTTYKYGIDYNLGDVIFVEGHHEVGSKMRVIESAMTSDKDNGESSIQTLAPVTSTITYPP